MRENLTLAHVSPEQLQSLHKALTLVDYQSLFSYYGYTFGAVDGGCWMVAKAIQQVAGGQLHCVELHVGAVRYGAFIHAVVKFGEDAWMDGRGLHTTDQLLAQWSHLENTSHACLNIQPLFFFPEHLERNLAVVEALAWTLHQLLELEDLPRQAERCRQLSETDSPAARALNLLEEEQVSQLLKGKWQIEKVCTNGWQSATD